jgi:bacterioferritin-associated ferredoxin
MNDRNTCTCHNISIDDFRSACQSGAHNVKTCFKTIGCLPKCNNCIPMVRSVLAEFSERTLPVQSGATISVVTSNASHQ